MTDIKADTAPLIQNQPTQIYPDILSQFTPETHTQQTNPTQITFAQVGTNCVTVNPDDPPFIQQHYRHRTFEPIELRRNTGPLTIHGKRWYFRLVQGKEGDFKRARALMDDFSLNDIAHHMVVCFTPDKVPGQTRLFRNKEGKPIRIYAFFDSYLEFFDYMQKFEATERAFYEIVFGELPQKPHFDVDMDITNFQTLYPEEDIDVAAETLRVAVISGCIDVLAENMVTLDIKRDLLLYSSHGIDKRSYHVVINNKCHDGNKEAKAFYDAVMGKIRITTGGKYLQFIDRSVYSPRQQFRLVGCQKHGSNRPKVFYEQFWYQDQLYNHQYNEDVTDITMKKLTIIYESMVSFCSGCTYLPSLIPPKPINQNNLGELADLEEGVVQHCFSMLREKMKYCPFSLREVQGHCILLNRNAPSYCPVCRKEHEEEHPCMFIISGKVYWDCRRSDEYADGKKLFVGYLAMTIDEMQCETRDKDHLRSFMQAGGTLSGTIQEDEPEDERGEFMFGDYNIGLPTLAPVVRAASPAEILPRQERLQAAAIFTPLAIMGNDNNEEPATNTNEPGLPTIYIPPPEARRQNLSNNIIAMQKSWAQQKYLRREPEDLTGVRRFDSVSTQISWTAGYSKK